MDPDKFGDAGEDNHEVSPGDGSAPLNTWINIFLLVCICSFFKHISATNVCFISRLLSFVQIFLRNFRIVTVLEEFHFETLN